MSNHRLGLRVPTPKATMETELPQVLHRSGAGTASANVVFQCRYYVVYAESGR